MRIASEHDVRGYMDATVTGGIKGGLLAAGLSVPGYFILMKRSATYRALPLPLKAFGVVVLAVPCIYVSAEKAGEAYTRANYSGVGQLELERERGIESERWNNLTVAQKAKDWAVRHKYSMIGAGWAGSLGLAFGLVARNPYQSTAQKVVQARMWAQGLTVALLLGSAVLTGFDSSSIDGPQQQVEDHSWKAMLEQDPHLTTEERQRLHEIGTTVAQRKAAAAAQAVQK